MHKSLTIYTENEEQLNALKAIMLSLDFSFKENTEAFHDEVEAKKNDLSI